MIPKGAFVKPKQEKYPYPQEEIEGFSKVEKKANTKKRLKTRRTQRIRPSPEKVSMTQITIYPGVRLFTFEGDPKIRLEGQTDEQREGTLNQHYKPLVVEKKAKMIVPGKNSLDAYKHTEGTFFRGTIGGKEYWATIGDVKQFAEIGREREKQFSKKAA